MQRTVPTASDRLLRARDRFVASDPGLVRLVSAVRAVLAIASTLGVEYLVATTTGTPRPATSGVLLRTAATHLLMTWRVSALIRLHGIWLWARRLPIQPRDPHSQEI